MQKLLDDIKQHAQTPGHFLGLLNVLIGRRVLRGDAVISVGLTWRELAAWLKKVRWDQEAVRELGLDPAKFQPRDRERFWYQVIMQAHVDTPPAQAAGDRFAEVLRAAGYVVK